MLFNIAILHDDDVPAGRRALAKLEEAGRKAGSTTLRIYALLNAYSIEVDAGDVAAIERLDAELRDLQVFLTATASEALLPAQALRAAWDGRFEHAYELLAPGAEKLFDDDRMAYRWAEIAVYAAAAGRRARERGRDPPAAASCCAGSTPRSGWRCARAPTSRSRRFCWRTTGRARSAHRRPARARPGGPARGFGALVEAVRALHVRWTTGWHGVAGARRRARRASSARSDLGGVGRASSARCRWSPPARRRRSRRPCRSSQPSREIRRSGSSARGRRRCARCARAWSTSGAGSAGDGLGRSRVSREKDSRSHYLGV